MHAYFPTHSTKEYTSQTQPFDYNQPLLKAVRDAVKGEAEAIQFYTRLKEETPSTFARETIDHALEDEKIHLQQFTSLYNMLTGGYQPQYQPEMITFSSFKDGLFKAYERELEAYEDYRNAYLLTQNQTVRDVFYRALSDEIEHAVRFSFLYSNNN